MTRAQTIIASAAQAVAGINDPRDRLARQVGILQGVGDEATWGECTGHPADPRTSELDEDALDAMGDAMAGQILHSAALDAQRIHDPLARMATHIGRLQGEIRRLCADLVWAREAQS